MLHLVKQIFVFISTLGHQFERLVQLFVKFKESNFQTIVTLTVEYQTPFFSCY